MKVTITLDSACGGCSEAWTIGSPSSASITFHFAAKPQATPFADPGPLSSTASPGTGNSTPDSTSDAGVAYATGGVSPRLPSLLTSDGYGSIPFGVDLGWTNLHGFSPAAAPSRFGDGMTDPNLPYLTSASDGSLMAVERAGNGIFFMPSGGSYTPEFFSQDTLASDGLGGFVLGQADGTVIDYYGFGSGIPAAQRGQLAYFADAAGNRTTAAYDGSGNLQSITRGDGTSHETYTYQYIAAGVNAGLVSNVTLTRTPAVGSPYTVQQVAFAYYNGTFTGTDAFGNAGDLKAETLEDAYGTPIGTSYFRYYTAADAVVGGTTYGYIGGLKYQFDPQSYARLVAATGDPTTASDAAVSPYADQSYQYDQSQRVTETLVQGPDGSTSGGGGGGGDGTYYYGYYTPRTSADYNTWVTSTSETRPDGNANFVSTNFAGEVMLVAFWDNADPGNPSLSGKIWSTYDKYDGQGKLLFEAEPSAVFDFPSLTALSTAAGTYPDIVGSNPGGTSYAYLNASTGLIEGSDYASSTTATSSAPGDVLGYLKDDYVRNGYAGTVAQLDATQYFSHTAGGLTVYPVASSTVYRNADGTGDETTSDSYNYYPGTNLVQSVAESDPVISPAQDGPGTADITTTVYDVDGRVIWTMDPDGFIDYTAYDAETGAVVESIVDVNTSLTGEFAANPLPSGWATPAGGGLNLITTDQVDGQGRTVEETSPAGNITYWVYDDPDHEVRAYPGWNPTTGTTTGPTQVSRIDYAGNYTETLTMTAVPGRSGSAGSYVPTGGEAISAVVTLDRVLGDSTGREVEDDSYFYLDLLAYSMASPRLGSLNTNYYATYQGYDVMGRPYRVVDAVGTITDTTYDGLGRVTTTAVGTDDTYTPGPTGPSNMVTTAAFQYDGNGVGDGNLTQETDSNHSVIAPDRVAQYAYDWRDRLVATKSGVQSGEDTITSRPIIYDDLDNLGEVTGLSRYDGDGVTLANSKPSSGLLRAYVATSYDDQGRAYEQQQYDVNQSTGALSTYALTTLTYYDQRGDVIATYAPGGLATKDRYDGEGRVVDEAQVEWNVGGVSWALAGSLASDYVLTETLTAYDGDDNPTLVTTKERVNDADLLRGPLGNAATGARVYYTAYYYDAADRPIATVVVGTDGGAAYTRPGTIPSRSDTVLVTTDQYFDAQRMVQETDPRGIVGQTYSDALWRPITVIAAYVVGPMTTAANQTTRYTYDGLDHTLTVTADMPAGTTDQVTTYIYGVNIAGGSSLDSNDLLHMVVQPGGADVDTYSYDAQGDVAAHADANGTIHTYYYDPLGRQTDDLITTLGAGVDGTVRLLATNYDAEGNVSLLTSFTTVGGSIVNQVDDFYDGLGQLVAEYQAVGGAVSGASPVVRYSYTEMAGGSNNSRPTSVTYPDGRVIDYQYNSTPDNAISRVDAIVDATSGQTLETYQYLGLGTVVEWDHPQTGIDLTYIEQPGDTHANTDGGDQYTGLDRFGRVIDQDWIDDSTGASTARYQYGYDRDGDVLYRNDLWDSALSELYHSNAAGSGDDNSAYDLLGRLTGFARGPLLASVYNGGTLDTVLSPSDTQTWSLDALGNWSSMTLDGTTTTRTFNSQDQNVLVNGIAAPTFDAAGNSTTAGGLIYTYDAWDRPVAIKSGATTIASYTYDAAGDRITETYSGTTTALYYSAEGDVIEERQGGSATLQYVWGTSGGLMLRDTVSAGSVVGADRLYDLTDANGDVTALVNTGGTAVERYDYTPYGVVTVLNATTGTPVSGNLSAYGTRYLFQGGRLDLAAAIYKFGARDYNPALGRWLEIDPLGLGAGDLNEYRFVGNSPVDSTDPTGEFSFSDYGMPSWSDYAHYIGSPGSMDQDLQTTLKGAVATAVVAGTLASGGALATFSYGAAAGNAVMAGGAAAGVVKTTQAAVNGGDFTAIADAAASGTIEGTTGGLALLDGYAVTKAGMNIAARKGLGSAASKAPANPKPAPPCPLAKAPNNALLRDPKSLTDFNFAERLDMRIKHQSLISRLRYSDVEMPSGSMSAQLMGELTVATEQEVALIRIGNQRFLRLGGADSAFVGDADRLIAHTHPSGVLRFSTGPESDITVFSDILTKQRSSVLVAPDGTGVRIPIIRP